MLKRRWTNESGAVLVFSALLLLVLIGFAALAVDLGNAWSTNRQGQSAADIAATSGLFAIPRTFSDDVGAPAPHVTDSVETEINDLLTANAPGATASAVVSADALDLAVAVTVDSENSFGRVLGAGDQITITRTASGHIEILPVDILRPFAFHNAPAPSQPYQCVIINSEVTFANRPRVCRDDFSGNGVEVDIVRMFGLDPPDCTVSTAANLRSGVDHLIDIDADERTEADACADGHILTMPNAAGTYFPTAGDLTSGLIGAGAPLAGPTPPLWEWLVAGLPSPCNSTAIASEPTLEGQTIAMRACLIGGNPRYITGLIQSPRFSWAIRTPSASGTREFTDVTLMFLNTIVSNDDTLSPEDAQVLSGPLPSGAVGAVTMYELELDHLSSDDQDALRRPVGTDYLEFSLTS